MPDYPTFLHEWFGEVWNKGDAGAIDRLVAADCVSEGLRHPENGAPVTGPATFKPFHRALRQALPDIRIEVVHTVSESDMMVARVQIRGTHRGEGLGLAPTGRVVEFSGMVMVRLRNRQIVQAWNNIDFDRMWQQLA
jgi:steroid delta-isomerase-like uncharacterized protein